MATVVFLVFAVFSLVWTPTLVSAAAALPSATCTAKEGDAQAAPVQVSTLSSLGTLDIVCPDNTDLNPAAAENEAGGGNVEVYTSSTGADKAVLNTVVKGAVYYKDQNRNVLKVVQLPPQETSIFFRCNQKGNSEASCTIHVTISAQPALGPQACAVAGSEIQLNITAPKQAAVFTCAAGKNLHPEDATKVYLSDCTTEKNLKDELPNATLAGGTSAGTMYTLTVPELPKENKTVCYVCGANADKCTVKVNVSKASAGTAMGVTARTASALGIVLVVAAFLPNF